MKQKIHGRPMSGRTGTCYLSWICSIKRRSTASQICDCSRPCYSERFACATFPFKECAQETSVRRNVVGPFVMQAPPMADSYARYLDRLCLSAN